MDSGNSGSLQSSSGGDDDYDSLADSSLSGFFISNNPPHPPAHHHPQQQQKHPFSSSLFDPLLNLDMVWSKTQRSEPDRGGFTASSSSPTQQFLTDQSQSSVGFPSNVQIPHRPDNNAPKGTTSPKNDPSTTTTNIMVRNPKKRSRASRRAPTTVLTTDTTNFRAMVQEFTGIPAPPFTSSPFPRTTRLDLFGTSCSSSPPPPYPLRPFAQKPQPVLTPSFLSPSSSAYSTSSSIAGHHAIGSATELTDNNNINPSTSASPSNSTSSINYQLLNNINMQLQNPVLNFQSLLNQAPPKYNPLSSSAILGAKQHDESLQINPSNDVSPLKMGVLEEFGMSGTTTHHHRLQNIVSSSSDTTLPPRRDINNGGPAANWVGDGVRPRSSEGDHHQHQGLLRSISGDYNNPQRVVNSNGKVHCSGSGLGSSDFHFDKGTENLTTRTSEGMVESWIFYSD